MKRSTDFKSYQFISIGSKGEFIKSVIYKEIDNGIFNLGFGDKDKITGIISDVAVSNNGDSKKVLLTVAETLYLFTENHPDAIVVATGSTTARTRLYQMGISNNLEVIQKTFIVMGFNEFNQWEMFRKNITYEAFLLKENSSFVHMKAKHKSGTKKMPRGVTIDKSLDRKSNDEFLFKIKLDKINKIIKTAGIPNI